MNYFYFNECIGNGHSLNDLTSSFEKMIRSFVVLDDKTNNKLIFEKEPNAITVSNHTLQEIIGTSKNKEFKKIIYSYLKNYPISSYINTHQAIDEVALLERHYTFENQDAINLAIAYYCDWIAFSLPVLDRLCKNKLSIIDCEKQILQLNNFYGGNIDYINNSIRVLKQNRAAGIEKIKLLTNKVTILPEFEKCFNNSSLRDQKLIIERFEYAKKEQIILSNSNKPNDKVVKHVSNTVEELRILNPIDIRVYFHQVGNDSMIIASMNYKNNYKTTDDQTKDIEKAEKMIKQIM